MQALVAQRGARQVDRVLRRRRHARVDEGLLQRQAVAHRLHVMADGLDDPAVDRHHHVVALGGRDEGARQDQVALGVLDADQHLVVALLVLAQADDGLRVQPEILALEGLVQARHPHHLAVALGQPQVRFLVQVDPVAAALLGQVAGLVGRDQELGHRLAVVVDLDHADAHAQLEGVVVPHEAEILDRLAQVVGDQHGLVGRAVRQQHAELVAAEPGQDVAVAHLGLQHLGQQLQQHVAGAVAAGVVDDLELVEVHVQQRVHVAVVLGRVQRDGDLVLELVPVDQAGQHVVGGVPRQLLGQLALVADVAEHHHRAQQLAIVGPDRRGRFLHRDVAALARDQLAVAVHVDGLPQAQALQRHVLGVGAVAAFVDQRQGGGDAAAARLQVAPASQLFGDAVQVQRVAVLVGGDDALADRAQRHLGQLALAVGRQLFLLALADVPHDAERAARQALLVAIDTGLGRQPVQRAVRPAHAVFDLVGVAAVDRVLHRLQQLFAVVLVDVLQEAGERLDQVVGGQAQQGRPGMHPVDGAGQDFAVGQLRIPDRHVRRIQRHAQALLQVLHDYSPRLCRLERGCMKKFRWVATR